jgi:hypothetical protein
MIIGDFNFYRSLENRNRGGGGDMQDVMLFNEIINNLGLQEIPLKGRSYTWSNMQENPLLQQIDWCFTSMNWISNYPNTLLILMAIPTSDHIPCMAQIVTDIPKAQLFALKISGWINQSSWM